MALYLALIFALFVIAVFPSSHNGITFEGKKRKYNFQPLVLIIFVVLFAVSAFRYYVGTDYTNYANKIYSVYLTTSNPYWIHVERGFHYLLKVLVHFNCDTQMMFAVTAFITIAIIIFVIRKNSVDILFSIFLFVALYFYFGSFNLIRQYVAMAFWFLAINDIKEQNFLRFIIKVFCAYLFHTSALILIPFYFIMNRRLRVKHYLVLAAAILATRVGYSFIMRIIAILIPRYSRYTSFFGGGSIINILILIINFALLLNIEWTIENKVSKCDDEYLDLYTNASLIALCFYIFAPINTLFSRMGSYFFLFSILSIPFAVKYSLVEEKHLFKIAICVVSTVVCIYYLTGNVSGVVPYHWVFNPGVVL